MKRTCRVQQRQKAAECQYEAYVLQRRATNMSRKSTPAVATVATSNGVAKQPCCDSPTQQGADMSVMQSSWLFLPLQLTEALSLQLDAAGRSGDQAFQRRAAAVGPTLGSGLWFI